MMARRPGRRHNIKTTSGQMPRDSLVGVHERQQFVAGGLATFSHPSLPHLTQLCYVTQYSNYVLTKIFISKNSKFCIIKNNFFWTLQ